MKVNKLGQIIRELFQLLRYYNSRSIVSATEATASEIAVVVERLVIRIVVVVVVVVLG